MRRGRDNEMDSVEAAIRPFSEVYNRRRVQYIGHVLRREDSEMKKYTTFVGHTSLPKLNPVRRVGRPRQNWAVDTMRQAWHSIRDSVDEIDVPFESGNVHQAQFIDTAAHLYVI